MSDFDDVVIVWTARHRYCQRFVRMARLRDLWNTLLGRPIFADEPCEDCQAIIRSADAE